MHVRTALRTSFLVPLLLLAAGLLPACSDSYPPTATPVDAAPAAPSAPITPPSNAVPAAANGWVGQWNGPEGTFLRITRQGDAYALTIANLDGPRDFQATATADGLRFERDGVEEMVRASNGVDTGMKWLADKKDCLVVKAGEGYCWD